MSFTNIHGLCPKGTKMQDTTNNLVACHQRYDIAICGISEHHIPMKVLSMTQRLHTSMLSSIGGQHVMYRFDSSSEIPSNGGTRLMGGTGIVALGHVVGRMEPKGKSGDLMGRWSCLTFRRQRLPPLTIISVYQVCPSPTYKIGHTAWHQQRRALDLVGRYLHPRNAFLNDIEALIQKFQSQHHALIIGGDWNECDHHTNSGILKLCTTYDLIDPWRDKCPQHPEVATFEFGIHRIDSVIISRTLATTIAHVGYSPVGMICHSDHRSLVLEFDTAKLFGSELKALPTPLFRGTRSRDKASVTTFIETMYSHLQANNAFHRAAGIDNEP
jgi:hypothetical protein